MTNYNEYKEIKANQNEVVDTLSKKLNLFPKGIFGMVEENIRMSNDYINTKKQFDKEFKTLQNLNIIGMKLFKKEIRKENEQKRNKRRHSQKCGC